MTPLEIARAAAAQHLRDGGFKVEAIMVSNGQGDDFLEVRIALALHAIMQKTPAVPNRSRTGHRLAGEEC